MGLPGARAKRPLQLIHELPGRLPATFHNVAYLSHAPGIGIADASIVGAAVSISVEASGGVLEQLSLFPGGNGNGAAILRVHVAIERC